MERLGFESAPNPCWNLTPGVASNAAEIEEHDVETEGNATGCPAFVVSPRAVSAGLPPGAQADRTGRRGQPRQLPTFRSTASRQRLWSGTD